MSQEEKHTMNANYNMNISASNVLSGQGGPFTTLKQKITEYSIDRSPVRIEWSYNGESGKGRLTNIDINTDYLEFFITDDSPKFGSFTLRSPKSVTAVSPQEGDDLCIFSPYMGNITILHNFVENNSLE